MLGKVGERRGVDGAGGGKGIRRIGLELRADVGSEGVFGSGGRGAKEELDLVADERGLVGEVEAELGFELSDDAGDRGGRGGAGSGLAEQ